jgi:uncharacterized protein YndB with AHSA1/START domain
LTYFVRIIIATNIKLQMTQTTKNSKVIQATPDALYKALTTPEALEVWQAPGDMTGKVHSFDLRVDGGYQMSLYYPAGENESLGKTQGNEDRFTVRFLELVPGKKIVEAVTFATDQPDLSEEMTIEISIEPGEDGTEVTFLYENLPAGIRPEDNEAGTQSSLEKLAQYVE